MAKKGKDDTPTASSVANRDIIQRLNFLYQASVYLNTIPQGNAGPNHSPSNVASTTPKKSNPSKNKVKVSVKHTMTAGDLAKTYIATMKIVGQKTTVKIDPGVKRTLCKGCDMTLIPGVTATVRVKTSSTHGHVMVYTCTSCKTSRRIPAPPVPSTRDVTAPPPAPTASISSAPNRTSMEIDPTPEVDVPKRKGKGKRRTIRPRIPPLFARDAGHILFRGNERLEPCDGVYIV